MILPEMSMYGSRHHGGVHDAPTHDTQALGLVPMVIETSGRGERAYDIYSRAQAPVGQARRLIQPAVHLSRASPPPP